MLYELLFYACTKKTEDRNNLTIALKVIWEMKH